MRNLRESFILGLGVVGLVACGSSNKATVDAAQQGSDAPKQIDAPKPIDAAPDSPPPTADTSCMSTPYPTSTSNATITLTGSISEQSLSGGDVSGAVITAKDASETNLVTTDQNPKTVPATPATATANFTFTATTSLKPVDGHLIGTKTGLRSTYLFPPNPLVMDAANADLLMLSQSTFDQLEQLGGASGAEMDGQGSLGIVILDCAGNPVEGATVEVSQGSTNNLGTVRYGRPLMFGGQTIPGVPNASAMSTDNSGLVFVFGVPAAAAGKETVITAKQGTVTFRAHTVKAYPTSFTTTIVVP